MTDTLLLLPQPRHLTTGEGTLTLTDSLIALDSAEPQALRFAAERLQRWAQRHAGATLGIGAGGGLPRERRTITLSIVPDGVRHPQGYALTITPDGADIVASTPTGILYGALSLCQIIEQRGAELPVLHISDWPDFPARGVMLDISRDKVPTLATLFELVDLLASWKINQLQLYTEHTFAYQRHPEVWAEASPLTGEEILALDAYCRERAIELVPNQNAFGHMHRWLKLDRYSALAEMQETPYETRWGTFHEPFSLCPTDPGSLELVRDMLDELLPHFSSRQVNVGADETIDLGLGRSKAQCAEQGTGRVYLDFLLKIYREVKARGRTMQFWGDIIMEHPELVPELPRDLIALEWGYEATHPFDEHGARFAASGVPFYVCPGTSTWNAIAGRTDNALANLRSAAENGLKHGAVGYLNTDWGDRGHWQPLPVSYLGFAAGAALSWACDANRDLDIPAALDRYAFRDAAGTMGRLAYDLGNVYQVPGHVPHNGNILFRIMQMPAAEVSQVTDISPETLRATLSEIDRVMAALDSARMQRDDADLTRREFVWAADMMRHGARRALWALKADDAPAAADLATEADDLIDRHREIWHARNRPGGFRESVARLATMRADYAS